MTNQNSTHAHTKMDNDISIKFEEIDSMSGEGYEQDSSRLAEQLGLSSADTSNEDKNADQIRSVFAKKRKTIGNKYKVARKKQKVMTDSGYERDVSSSDAGAGLIRRMGADEETQVLPYRVGNYVDHSLDPDPTDTPFAPLHRRPNFPEVRGGPTI